MSTSTHAVRDRRSVAFLTFNRPEARNAMTWDMYDALVDACDRVDADATTSACSCSAAPAARPSSSGHRHRQFTRFRHARRRASPTNAQLDAVVDRLERVTRPDHRAGPGRRRRRRLRHRARLRPARLHARGAVRRADRPHARQLPVGRQLRAAASTCIGPARTKDLHVHRPADRRRRGRRRSASSPAWPTPADHRRGRSASWPTTIARQRAADPPRHQGNGPPHPGSTARLDRGRGRRPDRRCAT